MRRCLRPIAWASFARCRPRFGLALLCWLCASLATASEGVPSLSAGGVLSFAAAEFVQSTSQSPPVSAQWSRVALPDSWRKVGRKSRDYGWYRLRFSFDAPGSADQPIPPQAIYISRITNNIEVFLNGGSFAVSGRMGADPEESWNVAQFYAIPSSLLKPGSNELLIRLHPDEYARPGIARVHLGDAGALKPRYERRYAIQTAGPQLISVLLVLLGVFSLTVWLHRRREKMFLLFGLMSLVASIRLLPYYLTDTPIWLAVLLLPAVCWLLALQFTFTLHYAARPMPRVERAVNWGAVALTLISFAAIPFGTDAYTRLSVMFYAFLGLAALPLAITNIYQLARNRNLANLFMIVVVAINLSLGIHDVINVQEWLAFDQLYLLPWGLPFVLLAVAGLLVQRFIQTLESYESLNTELAQRITEREGDLAASYRRERELDQQRVAAEERQKLMRDMHDGIGSFLMSTLALARHRKMSQHELEGILQDCIDELKLTIDSMEPVERDLLVVLGNLRYRLEPRLIAAGIALEWAVQDLPQLSYLDTENVGSILHIVQEALTNTLKHAQASRITLTTGVEISTNRVLVRLTDDGRGRHPDARAGRGLGNMRSRAARLGGSVEIIDLVGGGTCVNLYLPIR